MSELNKTKWLTETFGSSLVTESAAGGFVSYLAKPVLIEKVFPTCISSVPANAMGKNPDAAVDSLFNRLSRLETDERIHLVEENVRVTVDPATLSLKAWGPSA